MSKRVRFLSCDVFARLAYAACAVSPHTVDLELLPMMAHTEPSALRAALQARIDRVDISLYDQITLGYGLCGNATAGLHAPIRLVMPRAHDCCAVFLGSRERFQDVFGERLSARWGSAGYYERCLRYDFHGDRADYLTRPEYLRLLEQYGEDNAEYVWHCLHPDPDMKEAVYIEIDGREYGFKERYAAEIKSGVELRTVPGSAEWFNRLVHGPWDEADFLTVEPGSRVEAVYDLDEVVRSSQ